MAVQWLKHAFAVEKPSAAEPTDEQRRIVERLCEEIVRRGLTAPALFALEMSRPLNYIGAQAMHVFAPFIGIFTGSDDHRRFAEFLENRGSVDYICRRIEAIEADRAQTKRDQATARNTEQRNDS